MSVSTAGVGPGGPVCESRHQVDWKGTNKHF